jgi:inosose dehydratase
MMNRRAFIKLTGGVGALQLSSWAQAQSKRNLRLGYTGLTWIAFGDRAAGSGPVTSPLANPQFTEQAARDISSLGFWGVEYFSYQIEALEDKGGIRELLKPYNLPLISAYCPINLTDPTKRATTIDDITKWGKLVKKYGGSLVVIGPNAVNRDAYNFSEQKANIVATLNDVGKAANDVGIMAVLHPHTGTCIETRDETSEVLHAVDTRHMKFGPDIGQLQKGGANPVQMVKDFLPIVHHMHLKDYSGGDDYLGYCPVGQGKVNIAAILDLMEGRKIEGYVMVELDGSPSQPLTALETAKIAKTYLQKLGLPFRGVL